ncbi:ABC-three component system protein [Fuerstiella marisgermanici]|uniref:ABC-three component systems C-terminal domain-containing protein n=1 Tax=Fuerstiella marisgermanici TaxID=1891926 RepID=A0A1P8WMS0_9PLAN|nr:ABC-three component system protein [Fuerstiella marisgermanici]APZ95365.1 hypothetical protein Fuma_05023 [Fuerstiella marisgermanici]
MNISYHNLSDTQFEELVIEFCVELLGDGVQGFVTGKDGGRDARFSGKAQRIPSTSHPWSGTIIIQAKHTELLNKKFSEADFLGADSILFGEFPRIKKLVAAGELDYYILFANRRLTGVTDETVRKAIEAATGLVHSRIRLYDSSELDRLTKRFPKAVDRADLNPARAPADIDPEDLAEVIMKLAEYKVQLDELMEGDTPPPEKRITPAEKNEATGLRAEYFNSQIRPKMVDFGSIDKFLGHPDNQPYVSLYEDTAEELEAKLVAWGNSGVVYEKLLEDLICRLFARDIDLRKNRRLTRTVVFYMYCRCDIAKDIG